MAKPPKGCGKWNVLPVVVQEAADKQAGKGRKTGQFMRKSRLDTNRLGCRRLLRAGHTERPPRVRKWEAPR